MIKRIDSRVMNKIGTQKNWEDTSGFIPLKGEIIIYSVDDNYDKPRMKIGDGIRTIMDLPFASGIIEETFDEPIPYPYQSNTLTYNGTTQSVVWENYDASKMTLSGNNTTSAMNAGTYQVTFTPKSGYCWENNSTHPYETSWSINKAESSCVISPENVIIESNLENRSIFYVHYNASQGSIQLSYDTNSLETYLMEDATDSLSGVPMLEGYTNTQYYELYIKDGVTSTQFTITANLIGNNNYNNSSNSASATLQMQKSLNDYTWEEISEISQAGLAEQYFSIGDTKKIVLTGSVGSLSLTNYETYVYIIDFNHDMYNSNSIQFGTFKTSDGKDICLIDNNYGQNTAPGVTGTAAFNMMGSNSDTGGWKDSYMRYMILGSTHELGQDAVTSTLPSRGLFSTLPTELKAFIKPMTIYTNHDSEGQLSVILATKDYLPLLSETEIIGAPRYSHEDDEYNQNQYAYYTLGNSTLKCKYNSTTIPANYWTRSLSSSSNNQFVYAASLSGSSGFTGGMYSFGIAPVFKV